MHSTNNNSNKRNNEEKHKQPEIDSSANNGEGTSGTRAQTAGDTATEAGVRNETEAGTSARRQTDGAGLSGTNAKIATASSARQADVEKPADVTFTIENVDDVGIMQQKKPPTVVQSRTDVFNEQFANEALHPTTKVIFNGLDVNTEVQPLSDDFKQISDPKGYLTYSVKYEDQFTKKDKLRASEADDRIVGPTVNLFKYGAAVVNIDLNRDFFDTATGIDLTKGIPLVQDLLVPIGVTAGAEQSAEYVSGLLMVLFKVMTDNRLVIVGETTTPMSNTLSTVVNNVLRTTYHNNVGVNPALLRDFTQVNWLNRDITNMLQQAGTKYGLGLTETRLDYVRLVKTIVGHALNIDHFAASVLNINLRALMEANVTADDRIKALQAHSMISTQFHGPNQGALRPELAFDHDHIIRCLMLAAANYPRLEGIIVQINTGYVASANVIRPVSEKRYFPENLEQNQSAARLVSAVKARASEADISSIHLAIAREVSPMFNVHELKKIAESFEDPSSIVVVLEFILFALFFPTEFNRIKGDIQNVLLLFFSRWYPVEYGIFIQRGATYTINAAGEFEFSGRNEKWDQSLYLSEHFPALFSDVPLAGANTIIAIMRLFTPQGFLRTDDLAIAANFPRASRNPQTYIPYTNQRGTVTNEFASRFRTIVATLANVVNERAVQDDMQKATRSCTKQWLRHLETQFDNITVAHTDHLSVVYATMSNFMLNFTNNFSGNHATFKPDQYVITSPEGSYKPIIERQGETVDGLTIIDTSIVWPILCQCTYPLVRQSGKGVDAVSIMEEIVYPDPSTTLSQSLSVAQVLSKLTLPDAFINMILSGGDSVVMRTYQTEADDDLDEGIRMTTYDQYFSHIRERLHITNVPDPIYITGASTPDQIAASVQATHVAVVLYQSGVINGSASTYLRENEVLVVMPDYYDVVSRFANANLQMNNNRHHESVLEIADIFDQADFIQTSDAVRQLRALMPTLSTSQIRHAIERIAQITDVDSTDYGKLTLRFLGTLTRSLKMQNAQIRRIRPDGTVLRYDDQIDIEAFRWSRYFLDELQLRRLSVGLRLITNPRIARRFNGVRIMYLTDDDPDPDFVPDVPEGYVAVQYAHRLFSSSLANKRNRVTYTHPPTGMAYPSPTGRPHVHMTINERAGMSKLVADNIIASVIKSNWVVDILDIEYTAEVMTPSEGYTQHVDAESIMTAPKGKLFHLQFMDGLLRPEPSAFDPPASGEDMRLIYPLQPISVARSMRAIVNHNEVDRPRGAVAPSSYEMDTGTLSRNGDLLYSPVANGQVGIPKLEVDHISFSNVVSMMTANIRTGDDMAVERVNPDDVRAINIRNA
uniref:Putative major core protein n=1 Tax=Bombyx mori cytoplasmic polyhedrosis virus TaxID=110829 RepID=Q993A5_CPVBM|nr:putative major core protein [Bombyx mori cypovirus 1]